ncbi:MAG: hypothetical protein QOC55_2823, partial [Thermoleophilaceae bacterium]|nr:hypothetical protein [Thermoleophilaceae bacterium]
IIVHVLWIVLGVDVKILFDPVLIVVLAHALTLNLDHGHE